MTFPLMLLDGRILPPAEARVPPLAAGFLCGSGVFTTAPCMEGAVFQWPLHLARLRRGCEALNLDWGAVGGEGLAAEVGRLAQVCGASSALARIMVFEGEGALWRGSTQAGGPEGAAPRAHRVILLRPLPPPRPPARVGVSPWPLFSRAPLRGLKLLSYAEPWRALELARAEGLDEALRVNERGEVAGACRAGVLWVRGGEVFVPDAGCGGLESTTQAWAVERLKQEGVRVSLGAFPVGDVMGAEEVLLFSAGAGVWSAGEFRRRKMSSGSESIAARLAAAYPPANT
jgi:branched-subunit amino acid aminotransferase/4-amino-4-deoxychorismate lyase